MLITIASSNVQHIPAPRYLFGLSTLGTDFSVWIVSDSPAVSLIVY